MIFSIQPCIDYGTTAFPSFFNVFFLSPQKSFTSSVEISGPYCGESFNPATFVMKHAISQTSSIQVVVHFLETGKL